MLLLSQDIADKTQVLFIGHIILHNDNKKISIELKEGIFMAVTNKIREIREQRGIYQDDLAAAIGYSTKTVGRIERGDSTPSAEFMLRISKYFNMLVEDVFHMEDWVRAASKIDDPHGLTFVENKQKIIKDLMEK